MKIKDLTVGMKIRHPQYGEGIVQKISNVDATLLFGSIVRTVDPELAELAPAEEVVHVEGLTMPLKQFVESHDRVYVVEQNRDAQLRDLIRMELPEHSMKIRSVRHYDGLPVNARFITDAILDQEKR